MASKWFQYDGGDPTNPINYTVIGTSAPTNCSTPPEQLCAIQADDGGGTQPVFDLEIALEMVQALQNQENTDNVLLKNR